MAEVENRRRWANVMSERWGYGTTDASTKATIIDSDDYDWMEEKDDR